MTSSHCFHLVFSVVYLVWTKDLIDTGLAYCSTSPERVQDILLRRILLQQFPVFTHLSKLSLSLLKPNYFDPINEFYTIIKSIKTLKHVLLSATVAHLAQKWGADQQILIAVKIVWLIPAWSYDVCFSWYIQTYSLVGTILYPSSSYIFYQMNRIDTNEDHLCILTKTSLMGQVVRIGVLKWHEMYSHDPELISSNPSQVELGEL